MRQQDSNLVEAEEVDNTVSVMDKMTQNELSDLNMKQGVVSVHEKGIEPHTSSDEVQNVDEFTLPELSRTSMSLVPYVKRSLTLQKLVMLGVDLDKVQRVKEVSELLLKSDFKKDLLPLFKFLSSIKVPVKDMGKIFTENPLLFKENVQNLELRVGYMIHKKFSLKDIASMAIRCSIFLLMDPHKLDEKLGFLQNTFQLTGQEVRHVAMTYPKILPWRQELIADVRFHIKEFIGFSDSELKEIILKEPSLYMNNKNAMVKRFVYLHNTMLLDHHQVVQWPGVLSSRMFIIKTRHMFLLSLGRAQYDPCQENFVSLKALVTGTDQEFCHNVAKCDVNKFYDFCKTI
ncbi:transcription termination factor 3 mitochondrial [Biomphalaria pfeifferi]|uniref:Transcription termination factor 3 mitochondrial n=1 Tax=Biomphalaria pfeifferi TaxID=112525 RepID=A0AAD8BGK4_BIOPF|nr:transcription termination factor 3 mitochondrial [Biomphalaria pfeifferi]